MAIANEGGVNFVNIDANKINTTSAKILKRAKNIQGIAKLASRKSIMTMAAPGFYMYPIVMSGGIDTPKQFEIAKAFQVTYASSVATAYSLNGDMDRGDTPQVSDFVQKFHQNDPKLINANLNAVGSALGLEQASVLITDVEVASATVMEQVLTDVDSYLINQVAWDQVEEGLVQESLNDIYRPYDRTVNKIEKRLEMIKGTKNSVAQEGILDDVDSFAANVNRAAYGRPGKHNATNTATKSTTVTEKPVIDKNGNVVKNKDGSDKTMKITSTKEIRDPKFTNAVVRNNNMNNLEPTMVNVQIVAHGYSDATGSSSPSIHNITLCIKAMPRIVQSSVMIASMIEACEESHGIFKFIKWTKGEIKTLDKILGISSSKKKAIQKNAKQEVKFLEQSRKRKSKGLMGRFLRNEVLPSTTVVITAYEAEKIKEACGVDLNRYEMAAKLMNKYYLLGFCIYDTEQDTMKVLFDADSDWGVTSFSEMSRASGNAKDVLNQNEILRVFGRK